MMLMMVGMMMLVVVPLPPLRGCGVVFFEVLPAQQLQQPGPGDHVLDVEFSVLVPAHFQHRLLNDAIKDHESVIPLDLVIAVALERCLVQKLNTV